MRYQWVTGAVGSTTIAQTTSSTYSATNEGTYRVSLTDANPNGDEVNDTWELLNAADVPNITVTVFNRWVTWCSIRRAARFLSPVRDLITAFTPT